MEKKKLLLVAVSVGVFLVIVVGAAILVFSPRQPGVITDFRAGDNGAAASGRSATINPSEILSSEELRGLQNSSSASPIQENRISANGEPGEIIPKPGAAAGEDSKTVISVSRPQTAAVPDTGTAKPAVKSQPPVQASQSAQTAKPAPIPAKPAASAAPAKKTYRDYWVQAGSYSTRDRADDVKKTLSDKGIAAIITNQEVNSQTYYRVRLGPYTSHNEADYWLAIVKSINGFETSQVWESQSKR